MLNKKWVAAFVALFFLAPFAQATPGSLAKQFSFSGTLFQSDGITPLLDSNVTLRLQVFNSGKTCVYYDESHTVDTSASDGFFSVSVGGGTQTPDDPGHLLDKIFHNIGFSSSPATNCSGGSTPSAGDVRYLRVIVTPTSGTPETLAPDFKILPTASALVAESLNGGLDASNILKSNMAGPTTLSQTNLETVFNSTELPKLMSLLAGSSPLYAPVTGGAMNVPPYAGVPGSPSTGQMWYDSTSNEMKFFNGSSTETLSRAADLNNLNAASITTGTLASGRLPAFTGDVTSSGATLTYSAVVPVNKGGTGVATLTSNSLLISNGAGTGVTTLPCSSGQIVSFNVSGPICVSAGGTGDFKADGTVSMTGQIKAAGSSASAPAYAFSSDPATGIFSPAANEIAFSSTGLERLRIDPSGNVGIGTTTPSVKLHVSGDLWANDVKVLGGVFGNSVPLKFGYNSTEHMRIDSVGKVGIGTTAPSDPLHVVNSAGTLLKLESTSSLAEIKLAHSAGASKITARNSAGSTIEFDAGDNGGTPEMTIVSSNGNVGIGTLSPSEKLHVVGNLRVQGSTDCTLGNGSGGTNCSSDIRLKTNVQEIDNSLEKILSLRGVEFDWNEKSQSPGDHAIGVIAQDVEKQFPTAVIKDSNTGYKKVDYAVLVAPVIQAFKELNKRMTALFSASERHSREIASVKAEKDKEMAQLRADAEKQKRESDAKFKAFELREAETTARLDKIEKMLKSK